MMTSAEILAALDEIAAHPGKKDKEALVAKHGADAGFQKVLVLALNPFITFGIEKVPERTAPGAGYFTEGGDTWALLDRLASRALTGNAAREAIQTEIDRLDDSSAQLFARILKKNLRAGFSENTVNKAFKGLIPTFPYMRCSLPKDTDLSAWDWSAGVVSQEKADGMFVNIDREPGLVRLTTRQGNEIALDHFGPLVGFMLEGLNDNTQTHGELLVRDPKGQVCAREIGNGMLNSLINGGTLDDGYMVVLKVWDQIPLAAVQPKAKHAVPYVDRLRDLMGQLRRVAHGASFLSLIDTRVVRSLKDAYAHYKELLKQGKEGTILKKRTAVWRDGTSKEQIKLKLEAVVDLEVVGVVPGRAGTKNEGRAGSLTCKSKCGQLVTDVAVKNEAMRDAVDTNPGDWIGRVISVCANSLMEPSASSDKHSLFLPRMVEACYRPDKTEADDLAQVIKQFENAVEAV